MLPPQTSLMPNHEVATREIWKGGNSALRSMGLVATRSAVEARRAGMSMVGGVVGRLLYRVFLVWGVDLRK